MKKVQKLTFFAVILCSITAIVYLLLTLHYSNGFPVNTWINGVYCTGKTIEQVNSELVAVTTAPSIKIVDNDGRNYSISDDDINLVCDYTEDLKRLTEDYKPLSWAVAAGKSNRISLQPHFSYDETRLKVWWESLPFVEKEQKSPEYVSIRLTENGYSLSDTTSNRLDVENSFRLLQESIDLALKDPSQNVVINLEQAGLYEDRELTEEQEKVLLQWEKVRDFQSISFTYDMGDEKITLSQWDLSRFLMRNEDGSFKENKDGSLYISEEKVTEFTDSLFDEYDTYKKERKFLSTRGDMISLSKGSYGTLIDRDKENEYLLKALTEKVCETHIPEYQREPYHRGKNDIGDTYIEIDMTEQKMYLYTDGICTVETEIVTGCTQKGRGTPVGIYSVYSKQRNRTLKGVDYSAFVKYWMPINGNVGIHDADWRDRFGGEIYVKSGSHGCINTPPKAMKTIYETVEAGIPVIVFY